MLIRFFEISTNTNDGVYRKSDFINPTTNKFWKKTDTNCSSTLISQGSFNFDISDGVTELVIQLTDNSAPMRVTHVVAETEQAGNNNRVVAYVVDSIEYMGNKQIKYLLVEDTFLSHINIVSNTRMLVNRTNDDSHFFEHDTTDLAYTRERTIIDSGLYDYTGKWELTTYVMPVENFSFIKMKFMPIAPSLYEQHSSLSEVKAKYPEVVTDFPLNVVYYGYIVSVGNTTYQAQYNFSSKKVVWVSIPITKTYMDGGTYTQAIFQKNVSTEGFIHNVKLISGDLMSFNLCLPVLDNVKAYSVVTWNGASNPTFGYVDLPSVARFRGLDVMESGGSYVNANSFIVAKRVVTGLTFGDDGSYRPTSPDSSVVYLNGKTLTIVPQREGGTTATLPCYAHVPMLTNASMTHKVKLTLNNLFDHEPFKNYYLSVYGQLIPIKAKLKDKWIYIKSSLSALSWVYTVYVDSINNTLMTGRISAEVPYAVDKYEEFLSQNSTYNTSKWVNTVLGGGTRIASGFLSGYMSNPKNAIIGAMSGAVSIGQDIWNYDLQERAMKSSPDTIKGNGVDYSTVDIMPYGIYLYSMAPTIDSLELMKTEYYAKGHPTNIITTIQNLNNEVNDIYNKCKFVAGRMVDMVYNYSITSRITERLKNGVFLLEDKKATMPSIQNVSYNSGTNTLTFDVYNNYINPAYLEVTCGGDIQTSTLTDNGDYYSFTYEFTLMPVSVMIYAKALVSGVDPSDTESYEYVI